MGYPHTYILPRHIKDNKCSIWDLWYLFCLYITVIISTVIMQIIRKASYYLCSIFELLWGFCEWGLILRLFLHLTPPGCFTFTLRNYGLIFTVRGVMDVWSIKETFLNRFYERYGCIIQDGWCVIDIGAGVGDFSLLAGVRTPHGKVFAFEPFPESYELLIENIKQNSCKNIIASPEAVGTKEGQMQLDLSNQEPLQFSARTETIATHTIDVSCVTLTQVFDRHQIHHCQLLKMDCEGAEYEILFSLPQDVLHRIDAIVLEYHDDVTAYTHHDLVRFFKEREFTVLIEPNQVHTNIGYLFAKHSNNKI